MVVPDRVVQAQAFVAVAPGVAGAGVFLHDDGRHAQAAQPCGQHNAALTAADDHDIGLLGVAQVGGFLLAQLLPAFAALVRAVFGTFDAVGAGFFFMAFEFDHGGQQRPGFVAMVCGFETQMAAPTRDAGLKGEPGVDHATGFAGFAFEGKVAGRHISGAGLDHGRNGPAPLLGADVPGERDEVAPIAVLVKQRSGGVGIVQGKRCAKAGQPGAGALGRCGLGHAKNSSGLRQPRRGLAEIRAADQGRKDLQRAGRWQRCQVRINP